MNDDQITALAREYAEYKQRADAFKVSNKEFDVSDCEAVIHFLLRRYCLVEKERVRREYDEARIFCENLDPCGENYAWNESKMRLLESLFPEIAKEVEG